MKQNFFAVDLGATSGRTILGSFIEGGLNLEEINRFPNHLIEVGGHFYWDIYALYRHIIDGLKLVAHRGESIASIGIDTWGVDFVLLGKDGNLLRQPYAYRDPHTVGAPEAFFSRISRSEVYGKTGIQVMNFNSLFQLDTLRRNHDSALEAADKVLFMPDALSYMLTGKMVTEYTIASTAQLVNAHTQRLEPELLKAVGLQEENFGRFVFPGEKIGTLTEEVQKITGLGAIPVIAVAGHDTGSYPELITEADSCEPFRSLINPDDDCFANPADMEQAIREYCRTTGQPVPEQRGRIVRCIFESLALRYRQVLENLRALSPRPIETLHVIGGGSRNDLLNQFTANAIGISVVAGPSEATAIGNVMIQAMTVGEATDVAGMRQLISRSIPLKTYHPQDMAAWDAAYIHFKNCVR